MSESPPPPFEYDTLAVHSERPGFCVAHGGPLVVPIWTDTATPEHVDLVGEAQQHVLRTHPKLIVLSIIRSELSMSVDDEVRARSRASVERFGDRTIRSVLVVESGSIRASFFRSVITSVYFLTRSSSSQRVTSNIDDGFDWLVEPLQDGVEGVPRLDVRKSFKMRNDVKRFADDVSQR